LDFWAIERIDSDFFKNAELPGIRSNRAMPLDFASTRWHGFSEVILVGLAEKSELPQSGYFFQRFDLFGNDIGSIVQAMEQ
jgi:hypothetical protein